MEQSKTCPFMSTDDKKVKCLRGKCQLWFSASPGAEPYLGLSNCAVAYLPNLVQEILNNTRLMKASMDETVAI